MEETISLEEIFSILKKHIKLIIAFTLGAAIIAAIVSYLLLTPIYQSSTQFIVNQAKNDGPYQNAQIDQNVIRTNIELINTYNVIITSNAILDVVIDNLDLTYTPEELKGKIDVSSEQNSQVVTVSVKDPDPHLATEIANETVAVFQEMIPEIMNVDNVSVLTKAITPENPTPVEPKPVLNIAIAVVLGLMIGVGLAFLIEYLDTKVHTEKDIEALGIPVIGTIYSIQQTDLRQEAMKFNTSRKTADAKGDFHHV